MIINYYDNQFSFREGLMTKKKILFSHVSAAIKTLFSNAMFFIPLVLTLGIIDTALFHGALAINDLDASSKDLMSNQETLIKMSFTYLGLMLVTKAIIGPFISILIVAFSRATAMGSSLSIGKAINFAFNRYSKVFLPFLLAFLSIQIGMIIIIPGVMFMMQYAFVDSVASLENEPHVLSRSKRLTKPRRKSLIILILPYVILGQAVQLAEFVYSADTFKLVLINSSYEFFLMILLSSFYMMYHERVTLISEKKARKKASADADAEQNQAADQDSNQSAD
jgi:hypothetical protein